MPSTGTQRYRRAVVTLALGVASVVSGACGKSGAPAAPPVAPAGALSGMAAQRLVVLPLYRLNVPASLAWADQLPRATAVRLAFDSAFARALEDRSLARGWLLPDSLVAGYKRNPTYAADPYALAEEPLRAPALMKNPRIPEPLATELRTMIAIGDGRMVLAPVELRLVQTATDSSRVEPVLRLALIDARASEVVWLGDVKGNAVAGPGPALTSSVAARAADLFAAP